MGTILAVFRSRTQTQYFVQIMRSYGAQCTVVQTPAEARVGCGISAKFYMQDLSLARRILQAGGANGFNGFYEIKKAAGAVMIRRIN